MLAGWCFRKTKPVNWTAVCEAIGVLLLGSILSADNPVEIEVERAFVSAS